MKRIALAVVLVSLAAQTCSGETYHFTNINYPGTRLNFGADGINNLGQIVGDYGAPAQQVEGYLYDGGTYTPINVPGASTFGTTADGINDSGQIVGLYQDSNFEIHGYLFSGGNYSNIDIPGDTERTTANGINDSSQIVGTYYDSSNQAHGFLYSGGTYTALDVPGGTATNAEGINNAGQIVGFDYSGGGTHGFLYSGGIYTPLNVPGATDTFATGINDLGQVVGYYYLPSEYGLEHGFIYNDGTYAFFDIPNSSVTRPSGINDSGQIVGSYAGGGFLATPVPEPSTLALSGIGFLVLAGLRTRKGRVALGDRSPRAPTDPDVRVKRIRLFIVMTSLRGSAGRGPRGRGGDRSAPPGGGIRPTASRRLGDAETDVVARSLAPSPGIPGGCRSCQ